MPKKTFYNLNRNKQNSIIAAAFSEFAMYDYNSASISKIVNLLGIAKGSIYQYFKNKEDLYKFLIDKASEEKIKWMQHDLNRLPEDSDFFSALQVMILSGIRFDLSHPADSLLLINAMDEKQDFDGKRPADELKARSVEFLKGMVRNAAEMGEIEQRIDFDLLVHFLNSSALNIGSFFEYKYKFTIRDLLQQASPELPIAPDELENTVKDFVEILKNGISPHQRINQIQKK